MILNNYGFTEVGKWELKEDTKSGITFSLTDYEDDRVIYAFVVDEEVKYIGVCESNTTTLKEKMNKYENLQGDSKRIAGKIKECLTQGKDVNIFALRQELGCLFEYKGLTVDLLKGIENPLIEELKPEWDKEK